MLAKHALSQLSYGPKPGDDCLLARRAEARVQQPAYASLRFRAALIAGHFLDETQISVRNIGTFRSLYAVL